MKLEVLVSCMYQKNTDIVRKTRINTDVLIINQTNFMGWDITETHNQLIRLFNTTERGLSRSRNTALHHATGDICLICDDDEILADNYKDIICQAFEKIPDAAIIAFDVKNKTTRFKPRIQQVRRIGSLKLASYQLALKRESILKAGVYYVPIAIGQVCHGPSTWFFGYDRQFFYNRGAATRHMMGLFPSIFYGIYYLVVKYHMYGKNLSFIHATKALFQGIYDDPINQQMTKSNGGQM